ncbi:M48 family metallopeptidase [Pseudopontixanthobacter vadosimaris]|uniref:M48 family metallopeptidase n=1 Tax=Pseudopontixanthobacter vadosimaris TaxID=2726450 RepID=UPI001474D9CB|nr:M48 family metallopeptidase [Pseudopontixanthobacter vadosimaris]
MRGPIAACLLTFAPLLAAAAPAQAATSGELATTRAALAALQADDLRLQSVGWRLATGNARFCRDAPPAIGLLMQDMAGYGRPDAIRSAAGIEGDIAVQASAAGSPADLAGLTANTEIIAIGDIPVTDLPPAKSGNWQRLLTLNGWLGNALNEGPARLTLLENGTAVTREIAGIPACRSRFELLDDGGRAAADGDRVVIGRKFAGIEYAEQEFAAAVAHELAHNVLYHRVWLEENGRKRRNIRLTEREADRLMPWLLANAGYDPAAAAGFMRRWGPRHDGGLFRARSHDGWDERVEFIEAELPAIRAAMARDGQADWSTLFRRGIPGPR